ncbi:hypothetical protein K402DRAFT_394436 [Aulographum hederae CBS 113979]|uniref:Uncharacterized protein n=1 Tax=Aulographum hederae CBS 113979 TaxID=1176131 RepID=A0A6G1GYE3_9PEZI|nr:hypothetical protein K402DRAFT_394436 [Aulographum hederae CBS 113979]
MSNPTKTYFLPPTWDYPPPPLGPIRLGNIIASPTRPVPALYSPGALQDADSTDGYEIVKHDVSWSRDELLEGRFGVWTEFLSFLGVGVDLGAGRDFKHEESYHFKTLSTTTLSPSPTYLTRALSSPSLTRHLRTSRLRPNQTKPLYVITSIKHVSGARVKSLHSRGASGELGVKIDSALLTGAPVNIGPEVEVKRSKGEEGGWEGGDDFVFAFGVRKVVVRGRGKGEGREEVVQEEYTKGAMYSDEGLGDEVVVGMSGEEEGEFVVERVEEEDVTHGDLAGSSKATVDGEEGVLVVGKKV